MVDIEVANILREIRERVRAERAAQRDGNSSQVSRVIQEESAAAQSLSLRDLQEQLDVMERARASLPPLTSKRSGWLSRLELWFKRSVGRALHWFTFEQINFNMAAHQALSDVADALRDYQQSLDELRAELSKTPVRPEQFEARANALEERINQLAEEQRVCFKQLALEIRENRPET